ncbi:hypothetical protein KIL84_016810 [Mauremys mutica]|uniref:Uncharacterized protein n=1 Tax=Mauremys mutica TaxID=74926 RepID=A0A9D3X475_9SAUR|nr:hypothetical protein KIL84_016810 [Mauremys mutica]
MKQLSSTTCHMMTSSSINTSWNSAVLTPAPSHALNANTLPLSGGEVTFQPLRNWRTNTKSSVQLASLSGVLNATPPGMKVLTVKNTKRETSCCVTGPVRLNMGKGMPRNVQNASWKITHCTLNTGIGTGTGSYSCCNRFICVSYLLPL